MSYGNGADLDDVLHSLPGELKEPVVKILNRSADVFQQIGRLEASSIRSEKAAIRGEQSAIRGEQAAARSEAAATRCESALAIAMAKTPSVKPPPAPMVPLARPKLPSILEASDDDDTKVTRVKDAAVSLSARDREALDAAVDALAIKESDAKRASLLSKVLGIALALFALYEVVKGHLK